MAATVVATGKEKDMTEIKMHTCPRCFIEAPEREFRRFYDAWEKPRDGYACRACRHAINSIKDARAAAGRKHGLNAAEGYEIAVALDFACGTCGSTGPLTMDHDHAHCPGKTGCHACVRWWLCQSCQNRLRAVHDDVGILRATRDRRDMALVGYIEVYRDFPRRDWVEYPPRAA